MELDQHVGFKLEPGLPRPDVQTRARGPGFRAWRQCPVGRVRRENQVTGY